MVVGYTPLCKPWLIIAFMFSPQKIFGQNFPMENPWHGTLLFKEIAITFFSDNHYWWPLPHDSPNPPFLPWIFGRTMPLRTIFFGKTGAMGWNLAKSNRVLMATRPGFFQFANWLKWPSEVMVFWKAILYGYTFKCIPEFWNGRFSPDKMSIFGQK